MIFSILKHLMFIAKVFTVQHVMYIYFTVVEQTLSLIKQVIQQQQ